MGKIRNWAYKLEIGDITIQSPVRLEGNISFGSNNNAQGVFQLYNLSAANRAKIWFQPGFISMDDELRTITLSVAKDGQSFIEIFKGQITEAYSTMKGGQVGIVTYITATFADLWWTRSSHTFSAGTSKREAIKAIINDMPHVTQGAMGNIEGNFLTDTTCDGNAFEQIQKISGGNCFIDNGKIYITNCNEVIYTGIHEISSDTSLLGTPQYKGGFYTVESMFIPEIRLHQFLRVESKLNSAFDNDYCVIGFSHNFVFDVTQSGNKQTTLSLVVTDKMPNQDISTTTGTSKTDANNYQTLSNDKATYKVQGENRSELSSTVGGDVESVYQYIQLHNGQPPNKKIIGTITWVDMIHPSGSGNNYSDIKREITRDYLKNCVVIATKLWKFKTTWFNNYNIKINSGWRTRENNSSSSTKGATNSFHLYGQAIDFCIKDGSNATIYNAYIAPKWDGEYGLGRGQGGTWIHVGLGKRKCCYGG